MVFITVNFVIAFAVVPRLCLTGFFLHSSYEKTNIILYFGLSLCLHAATHVTRTVSRTAHEMSFSLSGCNLTEGALDSGSAECWRCIFPRGELPRVHSSLQMLDRPCHTKSPACHSLLAFDADIQVSLHLALIK
jgi:hypothetical protein